jgi:hypothetical protein
MRRTIFFVLLTVLMALSIATPAALAQNPHYVVEPTCTVNPDNTVTCTGSVAGVGNDLLTVVVDAVLSVEILCTNPGGNVAPGQTQQTTVTGEASNIQPEHGRATFSVTTAAPTIDPNQPSKELGCPNNKWTASIGAVTVESATIQIFQEGVEVLTNTFEF